ncbi:MAG TPA: hypothetical protein VFY95_05745 [Sphingomicrobium sp.]
MRHWLKHAFVAAAALLLTGCLWGPGKFASDLTLKKDGSFILDYRGEIVLQLPPDASVEAWDDTMAHCGGARDGTKTERPCSKQEVVEQKTAHEKRVASKHDEMEQMAKVFGLPGLDDASNRAFAAKLMKYEGWRSVTYRANGVFDIVYHMEGSARQDFVFPALPDNDLIIPFIAIRRRADGSVLVTAPAFTGGAGPFGARAGAAAANQMKGGPVSRAQGRFTVITDGEILTNNSEDGASPHAIGRQVRWDVGPSSTRIPEALIRLR